MTSANNAGNEVYKIQFIAIKKPNKAFPNVESIGTIETSFILINLFTDMY